MSVDPLRPKTLAEYVGQRAVASRLSVAAAGAKRRGEPLGHVLLHGPPGLGKTTLAAVVAAEMGAPFTPASAPALTRSGDLLSVVMGLEPGAVLFVDEVHRLPPVVEEMLHSVMEDFRVDTTIDCGKAGGVRAISVQLHPFTLVGATTRPGRVSKPLRDRFSITYGLEYYDVADLSDVVRRSAELLGLEPTRAACEEIARRSRGTPRIANQLLRRVRDYATSPDVSQVVAKRALDSEGVDARGFVAADWRYLESLVDLHGGGPAGVTAIASSTGEDAETVEEVIEPFLILEGYVARTPRGRVATGVGFKLVKGRKKR